MCANKRCLSLSKVQKRLIPFETLRQRLQIDKKISEWSTCKKITTAISSQLSNPISEGGVTLWIMKPKNLLWFMTLLCHLFTCYGGRILVLLPLGSKSHKLAIMPVLEALAERGHNLTIVSGFKSPKKMTYIHEIQITSIDVILEKIVNWYETPKGDSETQLKTMITTLPYTLKFIYDEIMKNDEFQTIMLERS